MTDQAVPEVKPEIKKLTCPECGMEQEAGANRCEKCDYPIYAERFQDDLERVKKRKSPPTEPEPAPAPPPSETSQTTTNPRRGAFSIIPGGGF